VRALAELLDRPADDLARITTGNARRVYELSVPLDADT
jgi:predicted TIM-barrel fold metal-dependent hydrolase